MLNELRKIRYARFRLEMTAVSQLRLPPYKGLKPVNPARLGCGAKPALVWNYDPISRGLKSRTM